MKYHEIDNNLMKKNFDRLNIALQEDLKVFTALISSFIIAKGYENYKGIDVLLDFKTGEKIKTRAMRMEEDAIVFTDGSGHLGLASLKCLKGVSVMNYQVLGGA